MMLYAAVEEIFCFPLLCTSRSFLFHIRLSALLAAPSVMFQSECCGAKVLKFFYWLKSSSHPPSSWLRRFFYDSSLKSCEDKLLKIESVKNESKEGSKKSFMLNHQQVCFDVLLAKVTSCSYTCFSHRGLDDVRRRRFHDKLISLAYFSTMTNSYNQYRVRNVKSWFSNKLFLRI